MVTTALRERMRAILRARNYSSRTEETYIGAVIRFARHFGTPPDQMGAEHVAAYQVWLRDEKRASHVLFNQAVCALRFFYQEVLERPDIVEAFTMLGRSDTCRSSFRSARPSTFSDRSIYRDTAYC